ncbi:hypothetical protein [Pedobacter frigiditerrae]|uniref:hypothetical protein n=1 Tax=Pedobacter frigiditerrae TaxID=2530452 RepID=UPI00292F848F|nr:hypothetical protein [Pedobacter frigiditerrae]
MNKFSKSILMICLITFVGFRINAQTVIIDNYYNQETKKDKSGNMVTFHYQWNETEMSGFSIFGEAFKKNGAKELKTLSAAPDEAKLKGTDIFIIVDPDNLKDNAKPNYVNEAEASAIAKWVKAGGVLLLMANDEVNADLEHLNILTSKFGFTFNKDLILHVTDDQHFADGEISIENNPIFKTAKHVFIKDASSIKINHSAKPVLKTTDGKNVMVSVKYGKGTVLAVGDPWLYNEYVNGRLPVKYDNDKAANDIASWLIKQIP